MEAEVEQNDWSKVLTCAGGVHGAHDTPCKLCGKINWKQDITSFYPYFDCGTKDCPGILWSD